MELKEAIKQAISAIKKEKARNVLIQLPDGLKPEANKITKAIEKETNARCFIWLGSCFGTCDLPLHKSITQNFDLILHFGHSPKIKVKKQKLIKNLKEKSL